MDRTVKAGHPHPLPVGLGLPEKVPGRSSAVRALARWHSNVPATLGGGGRLISGIVLATAAMSFPPAGHAATWADPAKTLRVVMEFDVAGFDPAATQDIYSGTIESRIFDALYVWDYLARPYRFVPSVAAAMPEISADGRTWKIRLKQGIYFAPNPAFGGNRRELTAPDFVYSWKRLVDPRLHSPTVDLLEGKLVGLDAAIAAARASGRFEYDIEIEGLKLIVTHFNSPWSNPTTLYCTILAMCSCVPLHGRWSRNTVMCRAASWIIRSAQAPIALRIDGTDRRSSSRPIQTTVKTTFLQHLRTRMPKRERWQQR